MSDEPAVRVFFWGSHINREVVAEANLVPGRCQVARGCRLRNRHQPRANLERSERSIIHGVVTATYAELENLYVEHANGKLGEIYLPEAIRAETAAGRFEPVLCHISHVMVTPGAAETAYVDRIAGLARQLGFPDCCVSTYRKLQGAGCQ